MSGYVYFTDDQERQTNAVDLEDLLVRQGEWLLRSGRERRLDSDHSIAARESEWYDHAARKGDLAIDFVQAFYDRNFPDAVTMLLDGERGQPYRPRERREPEPPKPFVLSKAHSDIRQVFAYLIKTRCLSRNVVSVFARAKLIYEGSQYHNTVLVGMDKDRVARHAHKRGTYTQGDVFKGNVDGCDPKYSFYFTGQSDTVYTFEAPINLLSFISLCQRDWEKHNCIVPCGVSERALIQHLADNPQIQEIGLCLDHDKVDIQAREQIGKALSEQGYKNVFSLFSYQKDWNGDPQALREQAASQITEQKKTMQMTRGEEVCRRGKS